MKDNVNKWKPHPNILEINTWVWLNELSKNYNKDISLDIIPEEVFTNYLANFDAIWLMGVWERSLASKKIAQEHLGLQREFHKALDDFNIDDVIGSPYAVYYYHVDSRLGGNKALQALREKLRKNDIKLILDYVPNHVARDHLWTLETEDIFIKGGEQDLKHYSQDFFERYDKILAHGKDPNFPSWTDTVQINAFSEKAREKTINTLLLIAEKCDGVRIDMAMLMTNEVFKRTWGDKVGQPPEREFWEEVIPKVKQKYPNFKFIGEVYWEMEWQLMQQGFDYCYDKRLYDRIIDKNIQSIKNHLTADFGYQKKLVRFIENHDEPRIANIMEPEYSKVAALLILTLPGMALIHEGQMKGYNIRTPVQLKRRKKEQKSTELLEFYHEILEIIKLNSIKKGKWELCPCPEDNSLIAYHWWNPESEYLVIINMSAQKIKTRIEIPHLNIDSKNIQFKEKITEKKTRVITQVIKKAGFLAELDGYNYLIFEIKEVSM
jgi:glycosidase